MGWQRRFESPDFSVLPIVARVAQLNPRKVYLLLLAENRMVHLEIIGRSLEKYFGSAESALH